MLKIFSIVGLIIYFAVLLFSVTKEKKNNNVEDYFFGGRKLPFWALSITFIASWWGAGSALSTADLAYNDGIGAFWYYGVPVLISTFLMIIFSKPIRRVGYLTQGEMMKQRYNKSASKILSVMVLVFMTITAASQMVGIGMFFGTYLGLSYEWAIIIGTGIVFIYSVFGGFRGVVVTDIIQFVLLLAAAIAVMVVAMNKAGGFDNIQLTALAKGKVDFMNFGSGASKYIMYVITFGCAWMIQANVWQRISATSSEKNARKMTVLSFIVYIPLYLIVVFTGMAGIVLFETIPDGGVVTAIVLNYMSPIVGAMVFIGISAAIMSTMDSLINTGAMTIAMDLWKEKASEKSRLKVAKLSSVGVSIVALIIALAIRSILTISWMASDVITTGVFVPLIGGFIWKRGNSKGAVASMIWGLIYCLYNLILYFGVPIPHFWKLQSVTQVLFGVGMSLVLYVVVSLITKSDKEKGNDFVNLTRKKLESN
ncbi:MAG: sodium:solute symporter family protein [Clostridia bacterium]